jgi:hypothetical protein
MGFESTPWDANPAGFEQWGSRLEQTRNTINKCANTTYMAQTSSNQVTKVFL